MQFQFLPFDSRRQYINFFTDATYYLWQLTNTQVIQTTEALHKIIFFL